jgi:hypothetical protein
MVKVDKGRVYLFASPLDDKFTNFPRHPIFVPTLYRIALLSQPYIPLFFNIDADDAITVTADSLKRSEVYKIHKAGSNYEIIPEMRVIGQEAMMYPHNQIREAGNYYVTADHSILEGLSFNYNRIESDLKCLSADELEKDLNRARIKYFAVFQSKKTPLTQQIHEMNQGTLLWKWFILLTLLFITGEIILVRLLKD